MQKRPQHPAVTTLHIKNMVCNRCIRVVREELTGLGLDVRRIVLGEADIVHRQDLDLPLVRSTLEMNGFELIEDKRKRTIEQIKLKIIGMVQQDRGAAPVRRKLSDVLADELRQEYHTLSSLFSSVEGITIEHYVIQQKIERVKELLKYGERTLSEIAFQLGYSSVAHLSAQFKQVTGLTPSAFKKMSADLRTPLDKVR